MNDHELHVQPPSEVESYRNDSHLARLIEGAPSPEEADAICRLCDAYGDAAVAYLTDPVGDIYSPTLEQDFIDAYLGSYDNREDFAWSVIENFGWDQALATLTTEHGIPAGVLRWDHNDLVRHLVAGAYFITEYGERFHVFLP